MAGKSIDREQDYSLRPSSLAAVGLRRSSALRNRSAAPEPACATVKGLVALPTCSVSSRRGKPEFSGKSWSPTVQPNKSVFGFGGSNSDGTSVSVPVNRD